MARGKLQLFGCLVWFLFDLRFIYIAFKYACPPEKRLKVGIRFTFSTCSLVAIFYILGVYFPDDGEQVTAYWTGWLLEMPIGWCAVTCLWLYGDTKGQSLEMW